MNRENPVHLRIIDAIDFEMVANHRPIDATTMAQADQIVQQVRVGGEKALRSFAEKFQERRKEEPLILNSDLIEEGLKRVDPADVELLQRVAQRIRNFADAQLECMSELTCRVPGGKAGHTIEPIQHVGCYAPAGRFPLPSSVLMTVVPALSAGCDEITLATPNPSDLMLAAAAVAGVNRVLAVGGAHAIAAMAYGTEDLERCDLIVGPGNRWVTAAKKIVSGECGIDLLAGPSELVLVADERADPQTVAADLLAQAEHDVDARAFLITTQREFAVKVQQAIAEQAAQLPTAAIAVSALKNGGAIIVESVDQTIEIINELAPEHLELHCYNAEAIAAEVAHAGCIFIGEQSAEVFGDYGVGPNHTLPTASTARFSAGLNVFSFIRLRTWVKLDAAPADLVADTARLAELEGLYGHRNAALRRN